MNWILCLTLFLPLQDFHERKHKPEAAQSGEGFVHLRLQGGKISKLHLEFFLHAGEPSHGRLEPLELADGELCPSRHQVQKRKLISSMLSVASPTNYGNILIPNVSSIRTDFLVDSCVR